MQGKLIDSSKAGRHKVLEESMHDVIETNRGKPIGPVDMQEIAALHRKLGVETNAAGESFTPGELVTAAGIVMEETGAKPMFNDAMMAQAEGTSMKSRVAKKSTSYFFFGNLK